MKKAPTHSRIDAYTFILLMIHFEKLKVGRALNYVLVHQSHKYIPHSNHKEIAQSVHNHGVNNTF